MPCAKSATKKPKPPSHEASKRTHTPCPTLVNEPSPHVADTAAVESVYTLLELSAMEGHPNRIAAQRVLDDHRGQFAVLELIIDTEARGADGFPPPCQLAVVEQLRMREAHSRRIGTARGRARLALPLLSIGSRTDSTEPSLRQRRSSAWRVHKTKRTRVLKQGPQLHTHTK